MRATPAVALDFLRQGEELVLRVYDDARPRAPVTPTSIVRGRLTAGYGHTGPDVVAGMDVTEPLAEQWLREDAYAAGRRVVSHCGDNVVGVLTDHQFAALISFAFNLGGGPARGAPGEWTIWARLRAMQLDQVPLEMMRFVNRREGAKLIRNDPGLVHRRTAEVALWNTPDGQSAPVPTPRPEIEVVPSSVTRAVPTPPTDTYGKPVTQSKTMRTAAGGLTLAGVSATATQAGPIIGMWGQVKAVMPWMASPWFVVAVLAVALVGVMFWKWRDIKAARN